jgi:lipopolysaccharide transport system permease protein
MAALKVQHTRRSLGYLWLILEPMMNAAIMYVIFALIMHSRTPDFLVFLMIGTTAWSLFENSISGGMQSIQGKSSLLRQIYLPKFIFPITFVLSSAIKYLSIALIVLIFALLLGHRPNVWILLTPINLLAQVMLGLGLSMPLAIATVYFKDLETVVRSMLKALMFLSGVFYTSARIPENYQFWFYLNPMAGLIESYRCMIMGTGTPNLNHTWYALGLGILFFVMGMAMCIKMDRKIAKMLGP